MAYIDRLTRIEASQSSPTRYLVRVVTVENSVTTVPSSPRSDSPVTQSYEGGNLGLSALSGDIREDLDWPSTFMALSGDIRKDLDWPSTFMALSGDIREDLDWPSTFMGISFQILQATDHLSR